MANKPNFILIPLLWLLLGYIPYVKAQDRAFTQNKGQVTDQYFNIRTDIDFKLTAATGLNIFIGNGKLHYQWTQHPDGVSKTEMYRMDVELIGTDPNAGILTEGRTEQSERYYTNGLEGAVAHKYSKITYKDIYPHIDRVFYITKDGLFNGTIKVYLFQSIVVVAIQRFFINEAIIQFC